MFYRGISIIYLIESRAKFIIHFSRLFVKIQPICKTNFICIIWIKLIYVGQNQISLEFIYKYIRCDGLLWLPFFKAKTSCRVEDSATLIRHWRLMKSFSWNIHLFSNVLDTDIAWAHYPSVMLRISVLSKANQFGHPLHLNAFIS